MSADLWAAFGSPHPSNSIENESGTSSSGNVTHKPKEAPNVHTNNQAAADDDSDKSDGDSWSAVNDEIENAWQKSERPDPFSSTHSQSKPFVIQPSNFSLNTTEDDDFGDFEEAGAGITRITDQLARSNLPAPVQLPATPLDEPDDFGDFAEPESGHSIEGETIQSHDVKPSNHLPESSVNQQKPMSKQDTAPDSASLLDLNSPTTTEPKPTATENSNQESTRSKKVAFKEQPILYAESDSDDAGNWDDLVSTPNTNRTPALQKSEYQRKKDTKSKAKETPNTNVPPPTNLPPPSILMSLIGSLLSDLPERIRVTIVETWEDDEADIKKYIDTFQVAGRILAGRKLRWKRDTLLSQNMSIGMSGRQGGMKLAGVDRAEAQREEREASELVRNWRKNLGAIRSALAESGTSTSSKPLALPLIAESILVRTVKPEDGGIKASKCCIICGLKRDERAEKVDKDVWDQFGEWWTDHWGHTSCKDFWTEYESYLRRI